MITIISGIFMFLAGASVLVVGIDLGWHLHKHFAPRHTIWHKKAFAVSHRRNGEAAAVRPGIRSRLELSHARRALRALREHSVKQDVYSALCNLGYGGDIAIAALNNADAAGAPMEFEKLFEAAMAQMPQKLVSPDSLND